MKRRAAALALACVCAASCGDPRQEAQPPAPRPSYREDVQPIFAEHCLSCHMTGGVSARVALDNYRSAASALPHIRHAVSSREMPPWGIDSSGACGEFDAPRALSTSELQTVLSWIASGAPEGDPGAPLRERRAATVAPLRGDARFGVLDGYTPTLGPGIVRCAVIDPKLAEDGLLTGLALSPDLPFGVHQVELYALDTDAAEQRAQALESADSEPGFACFGGLGIEGARFVVGATLATPTVRLPDGTGVRLPAGRKLVAMVDYNVEIGLGRRSTIAITAELGAPGVREATWTAVRARSLSLAPGRSEALQEVLDVPRTNIDVLAVYPRMRLFGRRMVLTAAPPGGGALGCMFSQEHWDMHTLRDVRRYRQPSHVEAGSLLRLSCTFDTRGRTTAVHDGDTAEDEECALLLYGVR